MSAFEVIVSVQASKVCRRVRRDKVGLELGGGTIKSAAYNLLDLACVQVYTWTETGHFCVEVEMWLGKTD
jgi:hypothetical protein